MEDAEKPTARKFGTKVARTAPVLLFIGPLLIVLAMNAPFAAVVGAVFTGAGLGVLFIRIMQILDEVRARRQ